MLLLYSIAATLTLGLSLARFRHVLHPQVLLAFMLAYMFLLDFAFRGDTEEQLDVITVGNLWMYQAGILAVYLAIWTITFVHAAIRSSRERFEGAGEWVVANQYQLSMFSLVASVIVALEILKRLSFSEWSLPVMIDYSIAPRGSAPWTYAQGNVGDGNFIYQIVIMLLPLSGMIYAYQIVVGSSGSRPFWLVAFAVVLALLIADGSRTPVFLVILTMIVCMWKLGHNTIFVKAAITAFLMAGLFAAAAVMYEFRSVGLNLLFAQTGDITWTLYHQDDNYYRALNAMDIAATTPERWSAIEFFSAVASNPIPRFFWAGKPILLADFWGNYKTEWVTISFIGELVAMFGVYGGLLVSVVFGLFIYFAMRWSSRFIRVPGGIVVYFLIVLYGYMVFRSLFNLTAFAYLPAFASVVLLINRYQLQLMVRPRKAVTLESRDS